MIMSFPNLFKKGVQVEMQGPYMLGEHPPIESQLLPCNFFLNYYGSFQCGQQ